MGLRIRQTHYETIPTGEYQAVISDIVADEGQFGPQVKFTFDVITPGYENAQLVAWTSQSFSPKSKLFRWTQAAFGGRPIPPTWDFDSDKLIGRQVRLVVVAKQGQDGTEFNRVNDVLPVVKPMPSANGAPKAAAAQPQLANVPAPTPVLAPAAAPASAGAGDDPFSEEDLPF